MINKIILVGDVWKDPEERITKKDGSSIGILSLVTKEFYKNPTGEYIEKKEWHSIVTFGETAKYLLEKIKKSDVVYVEGQLQTRELVDNESGKKTYIKEVVINRSGMVKKLFSKKREASVDLIDSMSEDVSTNNTKHGQEEDDEDEDLLF